MTATEESQARMRRSDRARRRWPSIAAAAAVLAAGTGIGFATVVHRGSVHQGGTPATPAQPAAGAFAPAAYDQARHQLVLLGEGMSSAAATTGGTWIWDGSHWRRSATSTTPATSAPAISTRGLMADDPRSGTVLLYIRGMQPGCFPPGGDLAVPCGPYRQPQTWSWNGSVWHLLSAVTPDLAFAFVLDAATGQPLLLVPAADGCSTQTWAWNGGAWGRLGAGPPLVNGATQVEAATDPGDGHALLVTSTSGVGVKFPGCQAVSATWRWDGTSWREAASGSPWDAPADTVSLGADVATGQVVAFTQRAQTWVWEGQAWTRRHPAHAPVERIGPTLAFDAAHHQMLLVGGLPGVSGCRLQADTWTWNGTDWSELGPPRCPAA